MKCTTCLSYLFWLVYHGDSFWWINFNESFNFCQYAEEIEKKEQPQIRFLYWCVCTYTVLVVQYTCMHTVTNWRNDHLRVLSATQFQLFFSKSCGRLSLAQKYISTFVENLIWNLSKFLQNFTFILHLLEPYNTFKRVAFLNFAEKSRQVY